LMPPQGLKGDSMEGRKKFFQKGSGIVEYILVTALVAMAAMALFRGFRTDLEKAYQKAGESLIQGVDQGFDSNLNGGE